jgi:preprotein translocase subunit SecG
MQSLIIFFHLVIAIVIVGLVMLQQGKGASMGAAFGSGASNTVFGSRGPASFLMKLTGGLMALFFITSLGLGFIASSTAKNAEQLLPTGAVQVAAPVVPAMPQAPQASKS